MSSIFVSVLQVLLTVWLFASLASADIYLQWYRASNNRLNEQNRDRNNGNRLFDSQNNNRGGVNVGGAGRPYFYTGTVLPLTWTNQHGCGNNNLNCEIILQYMCDPLVRDGQTTNTIPFRNDGACQNNYCDTDPTYGRHESEYYYWQCSWRQRNTNLFTADQNLGGNSAQFTRQNANANRHGYECPEERDYYPWWNPSPWVDIAIITDHPERCSAYQSESQNVKDRSSCEIPSSYWNTNQFQNVQSGSLPLNSGQCSNLRAEVGQWTTTKAWNYFDSRIGAPDCIATNYTRDDHHGNVEGGFMYTYNWTIPDSAIGENCVIRIRYNITSGEFPGGGFGGDSGTDWTSIQSKQVINLDNSRNVQSDPALPSLLPIWSTYNLTIDDVAYSMNPSPTNPSGQRGYVFSGNNNKRNPNYPQVDIFGPLVPSVTTATTPAPGMPTTFPAVRLQLAINTAQFGRTFQDRTHTLAFRARPAQLQGATIWNIGVRGRTGNIVQAYPAVEHDFTPYRVVCQQGDFIHFQWTGSNSNDPNDAAGRNPAGKDRSNVIQLGPHTYGEFGAQQQFGTFGRGYPSRFDTSDFLGFQWNDIYMLAYYGVNTTFFDLGPRQVTAPGVYYYMATPNNNFSNRDHKATIVVNPNPNWSSNVWGANPTTLTDIGVANLYMQDTYGPNGEIYPAVSGTMYLQNWPSGMSTYSDWIYVFPNGSLPIPTINTQPPTLTIQRTSWPLTIGNVYWAPNMNSDRSQWIRIYNNGSASYTMYTSTVVLNQGGFYIVENSPNGPAIAGIVLSAIFVIAVGVFIYWKIRVQPVGGWKNWWHRKKPLRDQDANSSPLSAPINTATNGGSVSVPVTQGVVSPPNRA